MEVILYFEHGLSRMFGVNEARTDWVEIKNASYCRLARVSGQGFYLVCAGEKEGM